MSSGNIAPLFNKISRMLRFSKMVFTQLVARFDEVQLWAPLFDTIALRQIRCYINKFLLIVFVHIGNGSFSFTSTHNRIAYFDANNVFLPIF